VKSEELRVKRKELRVKRFGLQPLSSLSSAPFPLSPSPPLPLL
jgi:hypothetical protein